MCVDVHRTAVVSIGKHQNIYELFQQKTQNVIGSSSEGYLT
jgi:hypothetical protein